jgi:hypothetical protein
MHARTPPPLTYSGLQQFSIGPSYPATGRAVSEVHDRSQRPPCCPSPLSESDKVSSLVPPPLALPLASASGPPPPTPPATARRRSVAAPEASIAGDLARAPHHRRPRNPNLESSLPLPPPALNRRPMRRRPTAASRRLHGPRLNHRLPPPPPLGLTTHEA